MKRTILLTTLLAALAGCNLPAGPKAKEQAYQRWHHTRAQILHGVALEHFKSGQLVKAESQISEALALDPTFSGGRLLLGKIYIEKGQFTLAIRALTVVHKDRPESAEVLYLLGVAQEKQGLLEEALISYRRSQALDDSSLAAARAAVEVLATQGHTRQAQLYVESYLSASCTDPAMYELAGRLCMMQKDYANAANYYQQAGDLEGKNRCYTESLARAQFHAGQYRQALETLEGLRSQAGTSVPAWVSTMLGDCYLVLGRTHPARQAYQQATETHPSDVGCWVNLAKAALADSDPLRAILAARQALQLEPTNRDATMLLGYALLRNGQARQSLKVLQPALAGSHDNAELYCLIGRAHAAVGKPDKAMHCYATALQIEPDHVLAKELLASKGVDKLTRAD